MISVNQLSSGRATEEVIQLRDTGEVIQLRDTGEVIELRDSGEVLQLRDRGALVICILPLGNLLFLFFFNRKCISGTWGKLSFPIQYKC